MPVPQQPVLARYWQFARAQVSPQEREELVGKGFLPFSDVGRHPGPKSGFYPTQSAFVDAMARRGVEPHELAELGLFDERLADRWVFAVSDAKPVASLLAWDPEGAAEWLAIPGLREVEQSEVARLLAANRALPAGAAHGGVEPGEDDEDELLYVIADEDLSDGAAEGQDAAISEELVDGIARAASETTLATRLAEQQDWIERSRRRAHLGFVQRSLPSLDSITDGLRGVVQLHADEDDARALADLALQLAVDFVRADNSVEGFLFVPGEDENQLLVRMLCGLADIDEEVARQRVALEDPRTRRLDAARRDVLDWGKRLRVVADVASLDRSLRDCDGEADEAEAEDAVAARAQPLDRRFAIVDLRGLATHQARDLLTRLEAVCGLVVVLGRVDDGYELALELNSFGESDYAAAYPCDRTTLRRTARREALERAGVSFCRLGLRDAGMARSPKDILLTWRRSRGRFEEGLDLLPD